MNICKCADSKNVEWYIEFLKTNFKKNIKIKAHVVNML